MKIGILSDTHGNSGRTKTAASLLLQHGAEIFIHCGDIGAESVLTELLTILSPAQIPLHAVLGNVDYPDDVFDGWSKPGEFEIQGRFAELTLDGKRIAIIHGDDNQRLWSVEASGDYDYIFTGHTHVREDRRAGKTRIVNPGAIYRANSLSVAVLDLATEELRYLEILVSH